MGVDVCLEELRRMRREGFTREQTRRIVMSCILDTKTDEGWSKAKYVKQLIDWQTMIDDVFNEDDWRSRRIGK